MLALFICLFMNDFVFYAFIKVFDFFGVAPVVISWRSQVILSGLKLLFDFYKLSIASESRFQHVFFVEKGKHSFWCMLAFPVSSGVYILKGTRTIAGKHYCHYIYLRCYHIVGDRVETIQQYIKNTIIV